MEDSPSDSAVRVVVTPSQSSYFAGEPFTVTITLTNTRSPDAGPPRAVSHTHKRAAHSISSAPLARPPTSSGPPRSAVASFPLRTRSADDTPVRRNLIGKKSNPDVASTKPLPRHTPTRSMSLVLPQNELDEQIQGTPRPKTSLQQVSTPLLDSVTTPSKSNARSAILPLHPSHPHARKQSVLDGQIQLSNDGPYKPAPFSASAATSTYSLALDPISESSVASPGSAIPSPGVDSPISSPFPFPPQTSLSSANGSTNTHSYPPQRNERHGHPLGLGRPPAGLLPSPSPTPPRSASSSSFPQANTELVLYAYAQLVGTLHLTPLPGTPMTPDQAYALRYTRSALTRRAVVGGGSMDITSSLRRPQSATGSPGRPIPRRTHSRSSSISAGLMSLLSPSGMTSSSSAPLRSPLGLGNRPRTLSQSSSLTAGSAPPGKTTFTGSVGLGLGQGIGEEDIDPEAPLPTFEVQPSMLAVDLSLLPGQSRSYTYTVMLPDTLPPTYRGRALRFSYELVVGTCRSRPIGRTGTPGSSTSASAGGASISRVMKVPVRMYNNVAVNQAPRPYDILWPVSIRPPTGMLSASSAVDSTPKATVVEDLPRSLGTPPQVQKPQTAGTRDDLEEYARQLLASLPVEQSKDEEGRPATHERLHSTGGDEAAAQIGCRESVEIMTRNSKKVSYDVNKDGVKVASLTFTKSAYRLGETILGVVELNERTGRSRVLKLSATLEAQESLPTSLAPPSSSRHLRRVHAEHHSAFVASTLRTTFALDIPSDATPAFNICLGDQSANMAPMKPGGLEWKVRLCLLVAVASEAADPGTEGVRLRALVRDGPRGEWGSSWRAPPGIAPMEKVVSPLSSNGSANASGSPSALSPASSRSWAASFMASILGPGEREYHDGDEDDDEAFGGHLDAKPDGDEDDAGYDGVKPDKGGGVGVGVLFGGGESGWADVKVEMVECEVPIRVWPGNTAFKAVDVVFDV